MRITTSAVTTRVTPTPVVTPFRVDRATATRWATTARTASVHALGGLHRTVATEACGFLGTVPTQVR